MSSHVSTSGRRDPSHKFGYKAGLGKLREEFAKHKKVDELKVLKKVGVPSANTRRLTF